MIWKPWAFITVALAGWMNRQQQEVIEYLTEENRILREKLGHKRIILDIGQKRRLATAAAKIGRNLLRQCGTLFSPDTLLRWHRWLVARKYDGSKRRRGPEPKKANKVRDLVVKLAQENRDWGYGRIHGELKKLGESVSWQTVRRIMQEHGLLDDPFGPKRVLWKDFLKSHWDSLSACDFFTVETLGLKGLTRYLVFFVIDLATRKVEIAGIHADPCETQMLQIARNLTDAETGFLKDKRLLIHDRDPLFTAKFRQTLKAAGVRCLKMPKQSPNLNSYSERFVWTIQKECLNKMILFSEKHLRYVISQFMEHYHLERPHRGLGNRRIVEPDEPPSDQGLVLCRERLGGMLKTYFRQAG